MKTSVKELKNFTFLFLLSIAGFSCSSDKAENASQTSKVEETNNREEISEISPVLISEMDTIIVKNDTLHLSKISKSEFPDQKVLKFDTSEVKNILLDSARVKRIGRKLIFNVPGTKKKVILENTSAEQDIEDESGIIRYNYLGNLKDISQWLVVIYYYEGWGYLMIDQRTGEKKEVYGIPAISPDKKKFICSSADLIADYNYNGLQLFKVNKKGIELEWERKLTKWGPEKLVWETKNSILAEQIVLDSAFKEHTKYVRMTL